jgi:ribosomal protein S18 acetylase RimI-like enzyme
MENYNIKELTKEELKEAAEVIRTGFGTVARDFGLTVNNCPTNGAFLQEDKLYHDKDSGCKMYGLFESSVMIGYLQLYQKDSVLYELQKLTVMPGFRHLGLGRYLLDFARDKVKMLGGETIAIGIIEENTILKNWYMEYGFQHMGIKKFDHLPFTVGFMELRFIKE